MKENFDDILKRKWEEQSFPMDQNHRADMIELLNGKKRRRIVPIWWIGGMVVLTAVAGLFLLNTPRSFQPDTHALQTEGSPMRSPITKEPSAASPVQQSNAEMASSVQQTKTSTDTSPRTTANKPTSEISSTAKPLSPKVKSSALQRSKHKNARKKNSSVPVAQVNAATITSPDQDEPRSFGFYRVDESAINTYTITSDIVSVGINTAEAETKEIAEIENDAAEQLSVASTEFLDALTISELSYTSQYSPGQITPNTTFVNSFFLFGEAGAGMILASQPDFASGWKMRLGGGAGYQLSSNLGLSLSAGYIMQQGGFDFERTSTVNQAGFGTRSNFNSLTPDRLHFVYTRLGVQYRLRRHIFDVHGGIQLLYGAQGNVVVKTQDQFAPDATETSEYTWVVTDGLRKLHWTADVAYGYQLTPRIAIMVGTDMYFSSFTIEDDALAQEGYYWKGAFASLHPFITFNYLLYGNR